MKDEEEGESLRTIQASTMLVAFNHGAVMVDSRIRLRRHSSWDGEENGS